MTLKTETTTRTRKPREFGIEFSALDESWRTRVDLKEEVVVKRQGTAVTEIKPVAFTAIMARKYAFIYMFTLYFSERGEKAWRNRILRLLGWDGTENSKDRHRYQMMLYRQIRDLRRDFNFEVEAVQEKGTSDEGYRYYEVKSFGLFNREELLRMLKANRNIFLNILEEIPKLP